MEENEYNPWVIASFVLAITLLGTLCFYMGESINRTEMQEEIELNQKLQNATIEGMAMGRMEFLNAIYNNPQVLVVSNKTIACVCQDHTGE